VLLVFYKRVKKEENNYDLPIDRKIFAPLLFVHNQCLYGEPHPLLRMEVFLLLLVGCPRSSSSSTIVELPTSVVHFFSSWFAIDLRDYKGMIYSSLFFLIKKGIATTSTNLTCLSPFSLFLRTPSFSLYDRFFYTNLLALCYKSKNFCYTDYYS
jgi:hypothetical protein